MRWARKLASEMMRTDAGLHSDQARRHVGKPRLAWVVLIRPKRWERYGLKPWIVLLQCISPVGALFVESLQCRNSGAIGGTTDMPRIRRADQSDVNDPSTPLAVHCGNGFDADFSPYQVLA